MISVNNKTVWLTGASSGIGLALARQLANQGARLILTSRREQQLEELRQSLPNSEQHQVLALDLSQPEKAKETASAALRIHRSIYLLITPVFLSAARLWKLISLYTER